MRRTLEKLAEERKSKEQEFAHRIQSLREKASDPSFSNREFSASVLDLLEIQASLIDAKDREWDALGSNHVGMIFKSMEWRVDRLAAETEDARLLVKKFLILREKLNQLLAALEGSRKASPAEISAVLQPLEDWRYAGFENRFRGHEEEVCRQLQSYLPYFQGGGRVLDLGCGRGEFLELLRENGIEALGIDLNGQMVDICLEKGLDCRQGDILEGLAGFDDNSLAGIFSSQVVEHLPPPYLKRLVEIALLKLRPAGTIILETVNPTSVFALVQIYLLDLTHQKPIHPLALRFLLENAGFEDVEVKYSDPLETERLRNLPGTEEVTVILNQNIDILNRLLFAPPNFAAIGKKK